MSAGVSVLVRSKQERVRGGGILGISCGEKEEKEEGEKEVEVEVTPRHFSHNAMARVDFGVSTAARSTMSDRYCSARSRF